MVIFSGHCQGGSGSGSGSGLGSGLGSTGGGGGGAGSSSSALQAANATKDKVNTMAKITNNILLFIDPTPF
jgi:hypothetical protein